MNFKNLIKAGLIVCCLGFMVSCSEDKDDTGSENQDAYKTDVYLTDAPIDDANVDAAFITVANVMVNGKAVEGFQKTTINVSSLQNGSTELLGDLNLKSGTTSSITLVLDNETDASGNAPGNYVLTTDGEKKALTSGSGEIVLSDGAEIMASDDNQLILDFDLRKAIVSEAQGEYSFVNDAKLAGSVRAVNKANAGTITGTVDNMDSSSADAMVVFAYKKGTYSEAETQADGGARFAGAVTSSAVNKSSGDFALHFLEEGEYELHFASYDDTDEDAQLEFQGEVEATSATDLDLMGINVTAESETNVEVNISGILGL